MKNTIKAFWNLKRAHSAKVPLLIAALVAVISFLIAACGDSISNKKDDVDGGGGSGTTFTSMDAFKEWLSKQPTNTQDTPYIVKLNTKDIYNHQLAAYWNNEKYIYIDLSGSTITSIREGDFMLCYGLVGITIPNSVTIALNDSCAKV